MILLFSKFFLQKVSLSLQESSFSAALISIFYMKNDGFYSFSFLWIYVCVIVSIFPAFGVKNQNEAQKYHLGLQNWAWKLFEQVEASQS